MKKPYAFINNEMQAYATLKTRLAGNGKFDVLNAHIHNVVVMPGQIVIVGDYSTTSLCEEEIELMKLAQNVRLKLTNNLAGADGQIIRNYDLLQQVLGYGSIGIGAATGSWGKHLDGVKNTLEDIERLYKLSLARGTPIARQAFINQRSALFKKLDAQLAGIARWGTGLKNGGSIRKMLGLSTKSYLHTGEIQGYAKRIDGVAKAVRMLNKGTGIGIALNMMSTSLEITEACSIGRNDICEKSIYVEGSKLVLGIGLGIAGGAAAAYVATGTCIIVLGAATGGPGALACGIVVGAAGAYIGGRAGETGGELVGEKLYEWSSN
ncbi:hypothetical protein [Pseudomonas huanghezhanensis]|uniref:hypothetical protein n=1 Tax=Pseudomonas huanghezhanensis TaxID=3002903 RepID=UPI002286B9D1|nr:hypothetical protein [Pseudomonas sp. BSw22131]